MLRPLRGADVPAYADLTQRNFPEESRLYLKDPDAFRRIVARAFRWEARLVLGLLRLVGRPIGDFLAVEVDGRLAGTTFVFYDPPAATIVNVAVDGPYRRRGWAHRMLDRAEADARRHRCATALLDVLDDNAPALALYRARGYVPLRTSGYFQREVGPGHPDLPAVPSGGAPGAVRPFRRSDAGPLRELAESRRPDAERRVRPIHPGSFRVAPLVVQALGGTTAAWVLDGGGSAPRGFVRSSTSGAMASGHLTTPIWAAETDDGAAGSLLDRALGWFRDHPVRRIVCEVPDHDTTLRRRLESRGFALGLRVQTLAKPLASP